MVKSKKSTFVSINNIFCFTRLDIFTAFRRPISFQLWLHPGEQVYDEKNFKLFGPSDASMTSSCDRYITRPPTWNAEFQIWQHNLGARVRRACQHNFVVTRYPQESDVYEGSSAQNRWFEFPVTDWRMSRATSVDSSEAAFHRESNQTLTRSADTRKNRSASVESITAPNTPSTPVSYSTEFPTIHTAQRVVIRHGKVTSILQLYFSS